LSTSIAYYRVGVVIVTVALSASGSLARPLLDPKSSATKWTLLTQDACYKSANAKATAEPELLRLVALMTQKNPSYLRHANRTSHEQFDGQQPSSSIHEYLKTLLPKTKLNQTYKEIYSGMHSSMLKVDWLIYSLLLDAKQKSAMQQDKINTYSELKATYEHLFSWSIRITCLLQRLLKKRHIRPHIPASFDLSVLRSGYENCNNSKAMQDDSMTALKCHARNLAMLEHVAAMRKVLHIKSKYLLLTLTSGIGGL
jgi:hypothetical protein